MHAPTLYVLVACFHGFWQGLDGIAVPPGGRVLVHSGSGGVGSLAVQLAKQRGWHVTATCSPQNAGYCRCAAGMLWALAFCLCAYVIAL